MAANRSTRHFLTAATATLAALGLAVLGLAGCSSGEATRAPTPTTVAAVGQPTEAPTAVIDPAPVVTDAN